MYSCIFAKSFSLFPVIRNLFQISADNVFKSVSGENLSANTSPKALDAETRCVLSRLCISCLTAQERCFLISLTVAASTIPEIAPFFQNLARNSFGIDQYIKSSLF